MHDQRELVERRIKRTIRQRIRPAIHTVGPALDVEAWVVPGEPVPVAEARAAAYEPFSVGSRWGEPWGTTWFRCHGDIDGDWAEDGQQVEVLIDLGFGAGPGFQAEGLLYPTQVGGPIRGVHPLHRAVPAGLVGDGSSVSFLLEGASNPIVALSHEPTPYGDLATAPAGSLYRLNQCHLALRNDDVWHLDLDLQILVGLYRTLADHEPRKHELLRSLEAAMNELDLHDVPATAGAARLALAPALASVANASAHRITLTGHAHIDSAWLWPLRETHRKCARTFSSAVTLMEGDYPEYRFTCSQAAQYDWVEHDHPELFERLTAQVFAGRFVPVGSMWVEADCNLPSGESLARQFVWGRRYFDDKFGLDNTPSNDVVWIPDVFGYAGNFPQIARLAGCEYFLTQKLSWNQTNPFPHHSFWWEGIDGTRIFTHFPPVDTYNGEVVPRELDHAVKNFRDKGGSSRSLYPFGHGDGGGGPTREMLERARRVRGVDAEGVEGLPRAEIGTPAQFFSRAIDEYGDDAGVWRGELYFEMHRGTYTSQAKTKQGNRACELLLREVELWSVSAPECAPSSEQMEQWWKEVLLHQFHDIIPGSSIAWVHDDTEAAHERLLTEMRAALATMLDAVAASTGASVVNSGPFRFDGVVSASGSPAWASVGPHGLGAMQALPDSVAPVAVHPHADIDGSIVVDNGLVRVHIGSDGRIHSLFDHGATRECLAAPANTLQVFADHPNTYDAWDLDAHTLAQAPVELIVVASMEIVESSDLRVAVRVVRNHDRSRITQTYVVRAGSSRVDVETEVDWHQNEQLLKASFPLALRADDARYDVQYGHVRRPTHQNTSWDAARFEVCGHFWADVSEPDFGVALLNNGKYGHDCVGDSDHTTMRLTLLRSANYPDPDADRGAHRFTYALLPHWSGASQSQPDGHGLAAILPEAWALNLPPRVLAGAVRERFSGSASTVEVGHPGVVVTAVKAADDGSGDLVVRLHEAFGGRARYSLHIATDHQYPTPCDLLEVPFVDALPLVDGDGGWIDEVGPFEIKTLRFSRS